MATVQSDLTFMITGYHRFVRILVMIMRYCWLELLLKIIITVVVVMIIIDEFLYWHSV